MGEDEEDNGALIYRESQLRKKEAAAAVVAAATASSATGEVPRRIRPTMDAFSEVRCLLTVVPLVALY